MIRILQGDCRELLRTLPDASVHCCVTSPPYYGLRDYGVGGQMGREATPDEWIAGMVAVFREVRRILRSDGTCWINCGDSFADKQLLMMPARLALALQADGWWLRSEIIWAKPNPMPESVTDRPTSAHEKVYLLSRSARYYYDADAIREDRASDKDRPSFRGGCYTGGIPGVSIDTGNKRTDAASRNLRNVWTIATEAFPEAHFATFPTELAERCIKAGCPKDGAVLDPFAGAGTTGLVADRLQRNAIMVELSPAYCAMMRNRLVADAGMFAEVAD